MPMCCVSLHARGQGAAPAEEYPVAPVPAEVLQSCLTQQLRNGAVGLYSNNWGADSPQEGCDNQRAKRRSYARSSAGSVTTTPITTPVEEITADTHIGKMWQLYMLKTAPTTKILDACKAHTDAPS